MLPKSCVMKSFVTTFEVLRNHVPNYDMSYGHALPRSCAVSAVRRESWEEDSFHRPSGSRTLKERTSFDPNITYFQSSALLAIRSSAVMSSLDVLTRGPLRAC